MSTKAIIVHPHAEVHGWVTTIMPDWDTQVPVSDVASTWAWLGDGTLSAKSEILLFSDSLFLSEPEDFALAVANFAPNALVIVISEDASLNDDINAAVSAAVQQYGLDAAPYYFFDTATEDPAAALTATVANYTPYAAPVATPAPASPPAPSFDSLNQKAEPTPAPTAATPQRESAPRQEVSDDVASSFPGYTREELSYLSNSLGEPGMVVSSTSSKGGSGKTTVGMCLGLTVSIASRHAYEQQLTAAPLKIAVVDMDVRDGQIGFAINQTSPSILNFFVEEDKSIENLQKSMIHVPRYEVDMLLAPKRGRNGDYLTPQFYADVIKKLRLLYDLVILDTSVNFLDPLLSNFAYPESDAILFVTNLSKGAVFGMTRWMEEVTGAIENHSAGVNKDKVGVVINQSMGQVGMDLDLLQKAAKGAPLLVAIPADSIAVLGASNNGTLNELISKHELIATEYFKLAEKVWRKTPLVSPYTTYLNSPDKARDDALAGKKTADTSNHTPLGEAKTPDAPKKRGFFGKKG